MELVLLGAREELIQPDFRDSEQKPVPSPQLVSQPWYSGFIMTRGLPGVKGVPSRCPNEQQGQEAVPLPGWAF